QDERGFEQVAAVHDAFISERLEELDQRPLVVGGEPGLFAEQVGAEVMPLVYDEILAFADGKELVGQLVEDFLQVGVPQELSLRVEQQIEQLLAVRLLLFGRQLRAEEIDVGQQADRHALGKRPEDHRTAAAADEGEQVVRHPDQSTQVRRNVVLR